MPAATVRSPLVAVCMPVGTVSQVRVTEALPTKLVVPLYSSLVSTLPAEPPLAPLVTVKVSATAVRVAWPTTTVTVALSQTVSEATCAQIL